MKYDAKIIKEGNNYIASFPELPNINTFGSSLNEVLENAYDALNGCIESDFERGFNIPEPKRHKGKYFYEIKVKPHIELSIQLRKLRAKKTQEEIASLLGISYQAYQKLENPRKCNPTIKTLEKIANVLNKELEVVLA